MEFLQPSDWQDALAAKAAFPDAVPVRGGTDVMVEMNFDRGRPAALLDLSHVKELGEWGRDDTDDTCVRIGAGVTYTRVLRELGTTVPGLAQAARTVGSPQIRNRGTIGGNLGAASPAGDCHPVLLAADAVYEVESAARGVRRIGADEFYLGPKRNSLDADELIRAIVVRATDTGQQFAKIGTRNAMVIAACSFAVAINREVRSVRTGIGSAGPTPLRAPEAETYLTDMMTQGELWEGGRLPDADVLKRFGDLVAGAARPIDDVRATAAYRRHSLRVMARRTATWALRQSC
ncbi:MAG: FAD binding domain-containing protein [Solirubrobacteraceae bacterium]|nr:FAD binding domain-containing protein [Solirubrobacteraceae bacterium]